MSSRESRLRRTCCDVSFPKNSAIRCGSGRAVRYLAFLASSPWRSTLIASRQTPVAIVVDAKSTDPEMIRYRRQDIEEVVLIVSPGIPVKVIVAVPELEAIFFHDPHVLRRLFDRRVTDELLSLARTNPRRVLDELIARSDSIQQPIDILVALTEEELETLRQADVVLELADFLRHVRELASSMAG